MDPINLKIEAISKSNARLLGFPIKQYIIGQSFNTHFRISNPGPILSPRIDLKIKIQMDDYSYEYSFFIPELPVIVHYITREIKWEILNQGICAFRIHSASGANIIFLDKNDNRITIGSRGRVFHKIVSTTPEGVYEYWAMVISAIGLAVIAFEKIFPFLIIIGNWGRIILQGIK